MIPAIVLPAMIFLWVLGNAFSFSEPTHGTQYTKGMSGVDGTGGEEHNARMPTSFDFDCGVLLRRDELRLALGAGRGFERAEN